MHNLSAFIDASAYSRYPTFAETSLICHEAPIHLKLDEAIDEITRKAREKGIDINSSSWIKAMHQLKGQARDEMLALGAFCGSGDKLQHVSKIFFEELGRIERQLLGSETIASQKYSELGHKHAGFQSSLWNDTPDLLLPNESSGHSPNDVDDELVGSILKKIGKQLAVKQIESHLGKSHESSNYIEMSELEKRKIALARCVQEEGASFSLCLPALSRGLTPEEKKELVKVGYKAQIGGAVNAVATPFAAISKTLQTAFDLTVKPFAKAYALSLAQDFCHQAYNPDPNQTPGKCYTQLSEALQGKNPEVNKEIKEALPNWVKTTGKAILSVDTTLHHIDDYMAQNYYSHPGIVKAGAEGVVDTALPYVSGVAWRLGKRGVFAAKAFAETAKEARNVVKITKVLSKPSEREVAGGVISLQARMQAINSLIPIYTSPQSFASTLFPKQRFLSLKNVNDVLPEIAQGRSGSTVYFMQNQAKNLPVVLKDYPGLISPTSSFGQELLAYQTLRNLRLTHFTIPKIRKVGQWLPEGTNYKRGLLVMSRAEGVSVVEMLHETSTLLLGGIARQQKVSEISSAIEKIGLGLKELHGKYVPHQKNPPPSVLDIESTHLLSWFEIAESNGYPFTFGKKDVEEIVTGFQKNPGNAAFIHGDAHPQNFIWDAKRGTLTAIDTGSFAKTLDAGLKPLGVPAKDLAEMSVTIGYFGRQLGLSEEEISVLKQAFWRGYEKEFKYVYHTPEAIDFFECYWNIFVLNFNPIHEKDIPKYVSSLNKLLENKRIAPSSPPALPPIQSQLSRFLKDESGFIKFPFGGAKPQIQKFLGKVYDSIKLSSKSTPFNNLLDARRGVDLKIFHNTPLEKIPFLQNSQAIKFHPIPNQNNRNVIVRVATQKGDYILKKFKDGHDCMGEAMGYDLLRPLNLQNLIIPEVVAIGQEQQLYYLLKSYLEGPTIGDLILSVGSKNAGTLEKRLCFEECLAATKKVGSALGELQRKTSVSAQVLPNDFVDKDCQFWVKLLRDYIEMANADLKKLDLPLIESSGIDFMVKQRSLLANPPHYSYGFGDIHPGQFVYSKKNGTLGYIDAEYFPASVGLSREPLSVGIKDYYLFHSNLEITGILSGLKSWEIQNLQQAFKDGFYSEFRLQRSQRPAQEFFELYSAVDTIAALTEDEVVKRFIATKGDAGASFLKQQLQNKVKFINQKIGSTNPNSLTPEQLGLKTLPPQSKIGKIGMLSKKMLTIAIEHKDFQDFQPGAFNLVSIMTHVQKLALEKGATSIRVSFPYNENVLSILDKRYYDTTIKMIHTGHGEMPHKIFVKLPVPRAPFEAIPIEGISIRLDKYKQLKPLELDLIPENLQKFEVFSRVQDGIYHVKIDHVIPKKGFHVNFLKLKNKISELASENQAHTVRLHFGFGWEPETNRRMHQLLIRMFGEPNLKKALISFDIKLTN